MALNSLYPSFIRMVYTGNGHAHRQTIPVNGFVDMLGVPTVTLKSGATSNWTTAMDAYVALVKPFLNTSDEVQSASFWTMAAVDADPLFVEDYSIAVAGTNAGAAQSRGQLVITERTGLGGLYRWYLMEGVGATDQRQFPPFAAGAIKNLTDYMKGTTSMIVGRDGGYLTSTVSYITKENDALRKKFFLNV